MNRLKYLIVSLLVLVADAATKWLISTRIGLNDAVPLVPDLFQLVHVRNSGAAFGIGANAESHLVPMLLNIGALAVFAVVVVYSFRAAVTARTCHVTSCGVTTYAARKTATCTAMATARKRSRRTSRGAPATRARAMPLQSTGRPRE